MKSSTGPPTNGLQNGNLTFRVRRANNEPVSMDTLNGMFANNLSFANNARHVQPNTPSAASPTAHPPALPDAPLNPTTDPIVIWTRNDPVLSMTMDQRSELLACNVNVDIYTRVDASQPFTMVLTKVSKNLLETFSEMATQLIQPRSEASPSTDEAAELQAFKDADDMRKDESPYVWLITGHTKHTIDILVKYMINTCNPENRVSEGVTASIAARHLPCQQWMALFHGAYTLGMKTAYGKLGHQLNADMMDLNFEDALACWDYLQEFGSCDNVKRRFEGKIKGFCVSGPGLTLEELSLFWGTTFDHHVQIAAARQVAQRTIYKWHAPTDEFTLQELPEECWQIIKEIWQREQQRRDGHLAQDDHHVD